MKKTTTEINFEDKVPKRDKNKEKKKHKKSKSFKTFFEDGNQRHLKTEPYKRTHDSFKDFIHNEEEE